MWNSKRQESIAHLQEEKRQQKTSTENVSEEAKILALVEKNLKSAIFNMFKELMEYV